MFHKLFTRRRGVAIVTVALGISGMSLAVAGTAGAATFLNPSSVIAGSGSNTAYDLMTQLGTLFNSSPGCDLTASSAKQRDPPVRERYLYGRWRRRERPERRRGEPLQRRDLPVPGRRIGQRSEAALHRRVMSPSTTPVRRPHRPTATATSAQNYIEYAIDGVSWVHFNEVSGVKTDTSSKIINLTTAELEAIYNGTENCTVKSVHYTQNWICVGAKSPAPIDCYVAQTGSGTEKTWAADIVGGVDAAPCLNDESVGTAASHSGLFENEVSAMFTPVGPGTTVTKRMPSTTSPPGSTRWRT